MNENASELLIKIKTILESQGVDAAKAKLNELTNAQNASAASSTASQRAMAGNRMELERASRAAFALQTATTASTSGVRGLLGVVSQLGGAFGMLTSKVGLFVAAFGAGFTIGKTIHEKIFGPIKESETALADFTGALETLNRMKLDTFMGKIKAMADEYERAQRNAERLSRIEQARDDVQLAADLTANQAEFESGNITENERNQRDLLARRASEERKLDIEQKALETRRAQAATAVSAAEKRQKGLKLQAAGADAALNYAVEGLGQAGGDLANIGAGSENEVIGSLLDRRRKAEKELSFAREWSLDPARQRKAEAELRKIDAEIQWAPKIMAARKQQQLAAETMAATSADDQRTIQTRGDEIRDIDATLGLFPQRRSTAAEKFSMEQQRLISAANVSTPEADAMAEAARKRGVFLGAAEQILPLTMEDGVKTARGGAATRAASLEAIRAAARRIDSGESDADVWAELAPILDKLGTVTARGVEQLRFAIDQLDGKIGTIERQVSDVQSRERAGRGLD